ncbi:hypothetical protein L5F32_06630 [Aliarcobacter butzleri]|uniref:hypothetical protein n=1 Tax=Aliarcobacter butzleri TaxID=28197 RepID=UPI001EDBA679|nr:hypothetical protein [Aliarcobacter butzleri]MCG3651944.1 hypothetical protein [Aliarcobacter butzleri]
MQINIKTLKASITKLISRIKKTFLNYKEKFGITICILWVLIIIVIVLNLCFDLQTFILVGLAGLLASATVVKNIENTNKIEKEKKEKESSEFYLNKSISELNNVYELLKDKNNDRVTWILAARVLNLALELSKKIKLENHKEFYNLQEFQLKHKLLDLFKSEEYKKLSFYVGCNNPLEIDYNRAISEYFKNMYKGNHLAEISLYEIFSFLEYPDDFKDPLDNDKLPINDDELESWIRKGGAIEYKMNIKKYFDLIENKDGKYTEINYTNSTF